MKLSILIVNYNVQYFLEQCLHSVIKAGKNIEYEIIVVDNNSVDGSVSMLREKFPSVHLIENHQNKGFSFANNQAIRSSKGKYVLLLNPDTVVEEDTFEKVITFMDAHPEAGGLGVKMLDGKGKFLPESKRGLPTPNVAFYKIFGLAALFQKSHIFGRYHLGYLDKDEIHPVDILSGAFMLIRKTVLDKVGLLNETFFMYGEDIDLSYRIILGGYKNYYFPKTRIIHYKGESTKKSSVNYVFVFYKAMIIFAKEHFSQKNAKLFSFLINLAIYIRAGVALCIRFLKSLALPLFDFSLIMCGLVWIKDFYESHYRYISGGSYAEVLVSVAFPAYTAVWMLLIYLSGGYDKPVRLYCIARGVLAGTCVILIGYSLLPEEYRFSRALIVLGMGWVLIFYVLSRLTAHSLGIKAMSFGSVNGKRIAIIGKPEEFERVNNLLDQTNIQKKFIGFVNIDEEELHHKHYVGNIRQIEDIIQVYKINEIIFCSRDVSSQNIIDYMNTLVATKIDFKIAPPESFSIIGSNSINTAGDLYIIDVNSITKPKNKRNKRLLDIMAAALLLAVSPVLVFFQKKKLYFFANIFLVLVGYKTWVGYSKEKEYRLPKLKPSVLNPLSGLRQEHLSVELKERLNLSYSKNYKIENDIMILWRAINDLGN